MTLALALPRSGPAQSLDPDLYVTNAPVTTAVLSGGTLYIGGAFTEVGPPTGSGVPVNALTGAVVVPFPEVTGGNVYAAIPDGAGGWYIGGNFTSVGGVPRTGIARVLSSGTVSAWNPVPD